MAPIRGHALSQSFDGHGASIPTVAAIEGVVFDLDGTLVDTLEDITAALNAGLQAVELPPCERRAVRGWVGDGVSKLVERALAEEHQSLRREVEDTVVRRFREMPVGSARPYPGIDELLSRLSTSHLPMAVLSNKVHAATVRVVQEVFAPKTFTAVQGLADESLRKPDPRLALELVARMGLRSESVVMVGDTATDIETAARAGMLSVAVTWGFRDRSELERLEPGWLIDRPTQLWERILRTWPP